MDSMEDYLKPTEFCDCNNQEIINKAKELTKNDKTPKEAALIIFCFVRDQIPFMPGYIVKASETLKEGDGLCVTKSNLQVALLRAVNIPARYHLAFLSKECVKGIVSDYEFLPDVITFHPWCECYLTTKWIGCDTLFDKALTEAIYNKDVHTKEDIPTIDWDGENDLNTMTKWMVEDKGTYSSLDDLFREVQKEFEKTPIEYMNQSKKYTDSVRNF